MKSAPNIRFRIDFAQNLNLGPGKIALLEAIEARGSLSSAALSLGLSYRRAWLLLDSMNKTFDEPVAVSNAGGSSGGQSSVTPFGNLLIDSYRGLENEISSIAMRRLQEVLPHVVKTSAARAAAVPRKRLARRIPQHRLKTRRPAPP